jgi:hypothetical protein
MSLNGPIVIKLTLIALLAALLHFHNLLSSFKHGAWGGEETTPNKTVKTSICKNSVIQRHRTALVTLLSNQNSQYAVAAMKMLKSVRAHSSGRFDAIILQSNTMPYTKHIGEGLSRAGWSVCNVVNIQHYLGRNRGNKHWRENKLYAWLLTEYDAVVYMDTDLLAVNNVDYLFNEAPMHLSDQCKIVAPRQIRSGEWTDQFGLGLFMIRPDRSEFNKIVEFKRRRKAETGESLPLSVIVNSVYKDKWFELGFEYAADLEIYSERMFEWLDKERAANISMLHYTVKKKFN